MTLPESAGRIVLAVAVYFIFAAVSAVLVRRFGGNLKQMEGRGSGFVPLIGTLANMAILGIVLLLFVTLDGRQLSRLGIGFGASDLLFTATSVILVGGLAIIYVHAIARSGGLQIEKNSFFAQTGALRGVALVVMLLIAVSTQEEVLFRGYIVSNLRSMSPFWIIVIATGTFAVIHVPTNKVGAAQMVSWVLGGLLLTTVYVVSGSIWVVIVLHFAIDFTNVLVFNISGQNALYRFSPPLSVGQRTWFRLIQTVATFAVLLAVYGSMSMSPALLQ